MPTQISSQYLRCAESIKTKLEAFASIHESVLNLSCGDLTMNFSREALLCPGSLDLLFPAVMLSPNLIFTELYPKHGARLF